MEFAKFARWTQLHTSIAVMFGLILVVYEIRQNHELTRVQMVADNLSAYMQHQLIIAGEASARVLAKACLEENLSEEELVIFDVHARSYALYAARVLAIENIGNFDQETSEREAAAKARQSFIECNHI